MDHCPPADTSPGPSGERPPKHLALREPLMDSSNLELVALVLGVAFALWYLILESARLHLQCRNPRSVSL